MGGSSHGRSGGVWPAWRVGNDDLALRGAIFLEAEELLRTIDFALRVVFHPKAALCTKVGNVCSGHMTRASHTTRLYLI